MPGCVLYGAKQSLFTGKARAYLLWKGLRSRKLIVTPDIMQNVILPNIGWAVMPVLETPDGTFVQDTVDIIDHIETIRPQPTVMPEGPVQRFVFLLLQVFGDQWLTLPAMHYRWNYNEEWVCSEFWRSTMPEASPAEQYRVGKARGQRFKDLVPKLGITLATIPGNDASYEAFLSDFSIHLETYSFVFGDRPSLADFSLLGPL